MEFFPERRSAFDAALNLSFSIAKPKSKCGSLIVGPWYTDFLVESPHTANLESLHIFEYDIYEALAQMDTTGRDKRFRSKASYYRVWGDIADKVSFDTTLHFDDPREWYGGYYGDIARFWDCVTPEQMKDGRVVLILDTCSVNTLRGFQTHLRRMYPDKLQSGSVIMLNTGISRAGYVKSEQTEARVMESLTDLPYLRLWSCTYTSKNRDGYRGHRRKLSVFQVN